MATAAKTQKRTVAQFTGHSGTRRVITRKDQDKLIGVPGVANGDLIWEPRNSKIDVTDVHEEVMTYLKKDSNFKLSEVEVPISEDA